MRGLWTWAFLFGLGGAMGAAAAPAFPPVEELPDRPAYPDPLIMLDGAKVETAAEWREKRRPELVALFQHYMYGFAPDAPKVVSRIEQMDTDLLDGRATLKQVELSFEGLPEDAPKIHLALFLPNDRQGSVPVFLGLNKCGNHTVLDDDRILINEEAWRHNNCPPTEEEARGAKKDFWCVEYLISRGYGLATFHESNIDPDEPDFTDGIHAQYTLDVPKGAEWGTIRAWAWGLSRCVDYLVTDEDVDNDRISVIGHSRRGKTALLAAAMDERFAMTVPHQSGTGGCALSRNNDQETVERINRVFPHWFNDNFTKFDDNETKLPFDQHLIMALIAPRPLLDTEGAQDHWANNPSALKALNMASPVYDLLGVTGVKGTGRIDGTAVNADTAGRLLQYRLDTKHDLTVDYWKGILDFAELHLK